MTVLIISKGLFVAFSACHIEIWQSGGRRLKSSAKTPFLIKFAATNHHTSTSAGDPSNPTTSVINKPSIFIKNINKKQKRTHTYRLSLPPHFSWVDYCSVFDGQCLVTERTLISPPEIPEAHFICLFVAIRRFEGKKINANTGVCILYTNLPDTRISSRQPSHTSTNSRW